MFSELKKQMELAHANLTSLQKKYKDTVKIASMTGPSQNKFVSFVQIMF